VIEKFSFRRKARSGRKWRFRINIFGYILPLAALWGLILLRIWDPLPVAMLRLQAFDLYQRIAPREAVALPAVIVDIDDESLAEIGQWP
jgi:adenylate cyclase